jgi:tyrosyl-tRNA synthetase
MRVQGYAHTGLVLPAPPARRARLYPPADRCRGLDALAAKQIVPGYIGFDATAPSLHVGSLVQIMMLRRLQQAGHKPIVVMGGGTTRIGDPTGKDESRKMLSDETIEANIASIRTCSSAC